MLHPSVCQVACSDPVQCKAICGSESGCTNIAYVKLVLTLMPQGEKSSPDTFYSFDSSTGFGNFC